MKASERRRRGFTLIELVGVVFLVGILMAMVTARLDFLIPKYRLRGAAREVGAVMRQAKTRAASAGKDVYVVVDVSSLEYWLLVAFPKPKDDGTLPGPDEKAVYEYQEIFRSELPDGVHFVDVVLGPDQKVTTGKASARISPFGASNHIIVNMTMGDRPVAVKLNGLTGVITYHEEHQSADELLEDKDE